MIKDEPQDDGDDVPPPTIIVPEFLVHDAAGDLIILDVLAARDINNPVCVV